jgi:hypothetical protein
MVLVTTFSPENAHVLRLVPAKQGPAPAIMYQTAGLKMDTWSEIWKRIEGGTTRQEFESLGNLALSQFLMSVSHFLTSHFLKPDVQACTGMRVSVHAYLPMHVMVSKTLKSIKGDFISYRIHTCRPGTWPSIWIISASIFTSVNRHCNALAWRPLPTLA